MLFFTRTPCPAARVSLAQLLAIFLTLLAETICPALFVAYAQSAAPAPNSDPTYQALRSSTLSGEAVSVHNVELKRDA